MVLQCGVKEVVLPAMVVMATECPEPFFFDFPLFRVLVVVCCFFMCFVLGIERGSSSGDVIGVLCSRLGGMLCRNMWLVV